MNIHDEILCPTKKGRAQDVRKVVNTFIEETKNLVPLIAIEWHDDMNSWADK